MSPSPSARHTVAPVRGQCQLFPFLRGEAAGLWAEGPQMKGSSHGEERTTGRSHGDAELPQPVPPGSRSWQHSRPPGRSLPEDVTRPRGKTSTPLGCPAGETAAYATRRRRGGTPRKSQPRGHTAVRRRQQCVHVEENGRARPQEAPEARQQKQDEVDPLEETLQTGQTENTKTFSKQNQFRKYNIPRLSKRENEAKKQ